MNPISPRLFGQFASVLLLRRACILLVSLLGAFLASSHGELIPAERLVDWTPGVKTGVIGGIPTDRTTLIDVTKAPYNADNTGSANAQPAIQAAIAAAKAGEVVYLPEGTYRIDSTLSLDTNFSGKTLRGAGRGKTIIDSRTNEGIKAGSPSGNYAPDPPIIVRGGLLKGSTKVDVPRTDVFKVGSLITFMVENDDRIPVVSVYNYDVQTNQAPVIQMVRVVAKTDTSLSFFPPLFDDYGAGALEVRVHVATFQATSIGIEDLTLDASNYTVNEGAYSGISYHNMFGSWVKNVTVRQAKNYNLIFSSVLNCEVRGCFLDGLKGKGSNGAGFLATMHSSLFEDNIVVDSFPLMEVNGGSAGNVIAYNYGSETGMFDTNHAPHNRFNLYEGNAVGYMMSDGYFGGESELTLFRNYLFGSTVHLRRFTRRASVIANIHKSSIGDHGYPNIGNIAFSGTAEPSKGTLWRDYKMQGTLTARTDDHSGQITLKSGKLHGFDGFNSQVIRLIWGAAKDQQRFASVASESEGVVTITNLYGGTPLPPVGTVLHIGPGAYFSSPNGSYQERDLDVAGTLIKKGNRYMVDGSVESLGGDSLPDSLFRSTKPAFFGDLAWPPFDPSNAATAVVERIPAGYRYVHGKNPPGTSGDDIAPTAPASLTSSATGPTETKLTWTAAADNVAVTLYRIERSEGAGSSAYNQVGTSATTSFIDTGLTASTTYNYRVRASDDAGNLSLYSPVSSVTTPAAPADATAPSVPGSLTGTSSEWSKASLTWSASTDNVGVAGYRLERSQGAGSTAFTQIATPTTITFADSGLSASTVYNYRVRAADAVGNLSDYSAVATVTTPVGPDLVAPTVPEAVNAVVTGPTQIDISWTASTDAVGVTGYQVERSQGSGSTTFTQVGTSTSPSYRDASLTASTTYNYRVRATDAAGNLSLYSAVVTASTPAPPGDTTPPSTPLSLAAAADEVLPQVTISWPASNDNVGVTGYRIERSSGSGSTAFAQVAVASGTTYVDAALSTATVYNYRVRATDAAGNLSGYSDVATATTAPPAEDKIPPTAPASLVAEPAGGGQVNLAWAASTDNNGVIGYNVERSNDTVFVPVATSGTTTYLDKQLTSSTTYKYRVRAVDAAGNQSDYSNIADVTTTSGPKKPSNLRVKGPK